MDFVRPVRMLSNTHTIETGNGKMYATISHLNNKPLEVFIHLGKSGQLLNTFSEALGRIISIALQGDIPVSNISKTLIDINSDKSTWYRFEESDKRPTQILSIPDGIAKLLDRYYSENGSLYSNEEGDGERCPNCGKKLIAIEGCHNCASCGYSKCS